MKNSGAKVVEGKSRTKKDPIIIAIMISFICIVVYQVLIPPQVAIANNGDFQRLASMGGIDYRYDPWEDADKYVFFNDIEYMFQIIPIKNTGYYSTQLILIFLARILNSIFGKSGYFDIRMLGGICVLLYTVAYFMFLKYFKPRSIIVRRLVGILTLLILTDSAILQYFNSFYSEPAAIIFLMYQITFFTMFVYDDTSKYRKYYMIGSVLSGVFSSFAKTQDMLTLFPTFCMWIFMLKELNILNKPFNYKKFREIAINFAFVLIIIAFAIFSFQIKTSAVDTIAANNFNVLFQDILVYSPSPRTDLQFFDIEKDNVKLFMDEIGKDIFSSKNWATNGEFRQEFNNKINTTKIIKFYLLNPSRIIESSIRRVKAIGVNSIYGLPALENNINFKTIQHVNFGKYIESVDQVNHSFVLWSNLLYKFTHVFKSNFANFLFIFGTTFISATFSLILLIKNKLKFQLLNVLLLFTLLGQYLLCMIGDSARDDIKHFFLSNQIISIIWIFLCFNIYYFIVLFLKSKKSSKKIYKL